MKDVIQIQCSSFSNILRELNRTCLLTNDQLGRLDRSLRNMDTISLEASDLYSNALIRILCTSPFCLEVKGKGARRTAVPCERRPTPAARASIVGIRGALSRQTTVLMQSIIFNYLAEIAPVRGRLRARERRLHASETARSAKFRSSSGGAQTLLTIFGGC